MARQIQTAEKNGGIASDCAHWLRDWRAPGVILGAILLLALGVRIAYLVEVSEYPNFRTPYLGLDAALYHDLAKRVASGDLLLGDEVYGYSPLYAYFLGGLYAVFGESPWVPRIGNIGLGLGTIWLVYLLTVTLTGSRRWALIAPLGAALYGPLPGLRYKRSKDLLAVVSLCAIALPDSQRTSEQQAILVAPGRVGPGTDPSRFRTDSTVCLLRIRAAAS